MKEFQDKFSILSRRYVWHTVFRDCMEIMATAIHQLPFHQKILERDEDFKRVEELYMATIKKYNKEELDIVCQLYAIVIRELNKTPYDFLGELYQELEMQNKFNGEFFTPGTISRMMAEMIIGDISGIVKEKGFISISEPASGAGSMLIAATNTVIRQGFIPSEVMYFEATDINRICFNMCYIQMSHLGIAGHVRHGNTLTNEIWESWPTPMERILNFRYRLPVREPVVEAEKKIINKKGQFGFNF